MNCHLNKKKEELDTPILCLDLVKLTGNLNTMADFFRTKQANLRPHFKTHKTPFLAHMQINAGAIGMTCAKLGEAEVLALAGIRNILIANQITGRGKIARLMNLTTHTDVMVAVDTKENATELGQAAREKRTVLRVLVEIDVGMGRCGVQNEADAVALVKHIETLKSLSFEGLMGYEGHAVMIPDWEERKRTVEEAMGFLLSVYDYVESSGTRVRIVSGGGTGTYMFTGAYRGVTEIQAGSYLTMDSQYRNMVGLPEFDFALTLLGTVIHAREDTVIMDAGMKCLSTELGMPLVLNPPGWRIGRLSEEHGLLERVNGQKLAVGDKIEIVPSHGCTTINLHNDFYAFREGRLEAIWPITARGKYT